MILSRVKDALRSETAYWVAQNSFGVVVPLLFGLVAQLRFPLACIAVVFYGITSQDLSNDNTIGGRIIAGSMFMGATLSGGDTPGAPNLPPRPLFLSPSQARPPS